MGEHVARSADTGDGFFTWLVGPNTISRRSKVAEAEVNIYNYLQPVGNVVVCKAAGLGVFHAAHVCRKGAGLRRRMACQQVEELRRQGKK